MAILVDTDTKLCVSGITGREGSFHTLRNKAEALEARGVRVGRNPTQVAEIAVEILGARV